MILQLRVNTLSKWGSQESTKQGGNTLTLMKTPILNSDYRPINDLLYKSYLPKIINAAIEIGLFETLSDRTMSLGTLSKELNTNENITQALLGVLTAIDLTKKQDGLYRLSLLSRDYLLENSDANQLGAIKKFSGSAGPFDNLIAVLKGEPPVFNPKMWASREVVLEMEQGAKAGSIQAVVSFIKGHPEFMTGTKMCDFAGNIGYYSFALMQENKGLYSHVYDLPAVCDLAKELKKEEETFDRITYHGFDIARCDTFGDDYDIFFSSHFLYEFGVDHTLLTFLKKVNKSMKMGGVFISNHIACNDGDHDQSIHAMIELMTRSMGYPTHQLPGKILKKGLTEAGFGQFTEKRLNKTVSFPTLLLSARKIKEIPVTSHASNIFS